MPKSLPTKEAGGKTPATPDDILSAQGNAETGFLQLDDLAAGVAHEINNPVNSIINYAQILVDRLAQYPTERDLAGRIITEGERIAGIVQNLLICTGPTAWGKSTIHIQDLFEDCLNLFRDQLRRDGIRLMMEIGQGLPQIHVNSSQIRQVILNIISNARHALNERYSGRHPEKVLSVSVRGIRVEQCDFVRIEFLDHGTGIPHELLGKVLKPFFSTKPGSMGNGLGLSTSSAIVIQHGGKMLVESVFGQFTRITVDLPGAPWPPL